MCLGQTITRTVGWQADFNHDGQPSVDASDLAYYVDFGKLDQTAGGHEVTWDRTNRTGRPVGRGIYFVTLSIGELRVAKRVVLSSK